MIPQENSSIDVSIISAFKNAGNAVVPVLEAVEKQSYKNIDHYIFDGKSDDNTLEYLLKYNGSKSRRIYSEPDSGIANAWNNALAKSSGELVSFQGAGDQLACDAVNHAVEIFRQQSNRENCIIVGRCVRRDLVAKTSKIVDRRYHRYWRPISLRFWFPSCFISRALFEKVGYFNENKKIGMDSEWILRAIKAGCHFVYGDYTVNMEAGGVSSSQWHRGYDEYISSLRSLGMFGIYDQLIVPIYSAYMRFRRPSA